MRTIKSLSVFMLICLFTFAFSSDASASLEKNNRKRPKKAVGAPIDGGLLTVLGAAGVGYYLIRKKKKSSTGI